MRTTFRVFEKTNYNTDHAIQIINYPEDGEVPTAISVGYNNLESGAFTKFDVDAVENLISYWLRIPAISNKPNTKINFVWNKSCSEVTFNTEGIITGHFYRKHNSVTHKNCLLSGTRDYNGGLTRILTVGVKPKTDKGVELPSYQEPEYVMFHYDEDEIQCGIASNATFKLEVISKILSRYNYVSNSLVKEIINL